MIYTMNRFEKTILSFIREKRMLTAHDTVTVGVSGGADSVCLITVLHRLQRILKISLRVVHVDHMLRGKAAEEDAEFVRALCERLDVPFTLHRVDVAAYAKERGQGLEEAGREVRYAALRGGEPVVSAKMSNQMPDTTLSGIVRTSETGQLLGAPMPEGHIGMAAPNGEPASVASRIATAHTATDLAETVLLNLFRGSGLSGAAGILPVNGDIIRPLLRVTREEIEDYLRAEGIAWREDATNLQDDYARNRIRHHILPVAERDINARATRHLAEAAETFAEADAFIRHVAVGESAGSDTVTHETADRQSERIFATEPRPTPRESSPCPKRGVSGARRSARQKLSEDAGTAVSQGLSVSHLHTLPPILQQESVRQALRSVTPHLKNISRRHIDAVLDLCRNNHGVKSLDLPCGVTVRRDHDTLSFLLRDAETESGTDAETAGDIS